MRQKLNWGFLSTAKINRALIKPLAASKRTRLLAVASRSQSSADAYAREWNIPRAHGSYEALLADPEIDVIYNSLPNDLHAEWTIKALRAGKHVLCEKPIALTVTELDAMAAAAKESGRVLAEAFMYRHHPQTLKIKEMVDSSLLGQLQLIRGSFTFTLTRQTHRSDPYRGGGSIWDVGCYPISYARMIVGAEPLEVFGWQAKGPTGIDETFVGQMRFADGIHAQFDCGFNSPSRTHIEVPFKPGAKETIFVTRRDRTETIKIKGQELYLGEVEDMVDAILLGKPPRVSLADSRANISTILALIESSETGRPILL
ncbi:MAG: Gfo/Idh/MocA family oxidoreductase [Chloroflexi bacterium]|nr:Gfo/Idh/MocA family oxidoreductase [Chloroflexota bacterium]